MLGGLCSAKVMKKVGTPAKTTHYENPRSRYVTEQKTIAFASSFAAKFTTLVDATSATTTLLNPAEPLLHRAEKIIFASSFAKFTTLVDATSASPKQSTIRTGRIAISQSTKPWPS